MKLSILQSKIKEGINVVRNITSKSPTLPILGNILLRAKGNFLNLVATDLETGINWWVLAKVEKEGEITVPSRIFSDFVNLLPDKKTNLSAKDNILYIDAENYQTRIKGVGSENFPIIPKMKDEQFLVSQSLPFCQGLAQVVDFAAPSTTRPEISGVYMSFEKKTLTMAATDSFRLGEKKLLLEGPSSATLRYSAILPQKTAKELIGIFGERESKLKIYFSKNQMMFERELEETPHPQVQFVSKLIEGEYPEYLEIIPKKYKTQAILKRSEFLNQIRTASLFSGRINEIKIKFDPQKGQLELFCQNPDVGERRSFFGGKVEGQKAEVSFNHRFLIDGLANIKTAEVLFALSEKKGGEEGPGVLKPVGDETYLYIAMPIQAS